MIYEGSSEHLSDAPRPIAIVRQKGCGTRTNAELDGQLLATSWHRPTPTASAAATEAR